MANVEINVSNKIVDSTGKIHNSIRQLAKTIHVKRERISKSLNEKGVFVHNGISYLLYNKALTGTVPATPTVVANTTPGVVTVTVPVERDDEDEYQDGEGPE